MKRKKEEKKLKIGIDARFWGMEHAGLGRYVIELVTQLAKIDSTNSYTIFLKKPYYSELSFPSNFVKKQANIKHYSLEEQWLLPEIFTREDIDLLHVPHFNVPLRYGRPFIVTIHDLLWHEVKGLSVTTQNAIVYLIKYLGYRAVVGHALRGSELILVPSQTIKDKLTHKHKVGQERVRVIYEAPSSEFRKKKPQSQILRKYDLEKPFLIYTGSAYPHKNIIKAALAVEKVNQQGFKLTLAVSSSRSVFLDRLQSQLKDRQADSHVKFLGFVPDYDLVNIYSHALGLIQPSRSEGFGLTGLEAMASGLPVLASKIPVFEEIYRKAAIYFDPEDISDMTRRILELSKDQKLQKRMTNRGLSRIKDFSWEKLARKTLQAYKDIILTA